jgi:hypothetical protein
MSELLTASDVCRLLGGAVVPATVKLAADKGRLRVAARTPSGVRLFTPTDALAWQATRKTRV